MSEILKIYNNKNRPNLFIVNYNFIKRYNQYIDIDFHAIIFDEAHMIKNSKSILSINTK